MNPPPQNNYPQGPQQGYPQQGPNVVITQQVVDLPHTPIQMTCPQCKFTGISRVDKTMGSQFFICLIIAIIFFWTLIGLILLCCLCCNDDNYEFVHHCPNCNFEYGKRAVVTQNVRQSFGVKV